MNLKSNIFFVPSKSKQMSWIMTLRTYFRHHLLNEMDCIINVKPDYFTQRNLERERRRNMEQRFSFKEKCNQKPYTVLIKNKETRDVKKKSCHRELGNISRINKLKALHGSKWHDPTLPSTGYWRQNYSRQKCFRASMIAWDAKSFWIQGKTLGVISYKHGNYL